MKRKFTGIILCLMMVCISVLSGCALITRDQKAYLYQVVSSVVDKKTNERINITKKDLISAYNSYGYYYEQYYGYKKEEAVKKTLDLVVNRKITIREAKSIYSDGLEDKEKSYLWQQTADALEDNFMSYLNDRMGVSSSSNSSSSDERKFVDYTPKAELDTTTGDFKIAKLTSLQKELDSFKWDNVLRDANTKEGREQIYTNFVGFVNQPNSKAYTDAFNDYLKALKKNEKGLDLSTKTNEVFLREIERLYTVNYENYMITKYDEHFTNYSPYATITDEEILRLYAGQVKAGYTQYVIEKDSAYETNMQSDPTAINYYREGGEDTKFFQVAHVLFKFDTDQEAEYKRIQSDYNKNIYTEEWAYEQDIKNLVSKVAPKIQKTAEGTLTDENQTILQASEDEKNAIDMAAYIQNEVAKKNGLKDKATLFRDFIYKYNEDPGMIKKDDSYTLGYTIGVNKSEKKGDSDKYAADYKVYSNFVTEFTDAAVGLYENAVDGGVSDYIVTENGVHVLFYMGEVKNLFEGIGENFTLSDTHVDPDTGLAPIEVLASSYVNCFVNRTYFDVLYDTLITDNFALFQNENIKLLRDKYNISHDPKAYADLTK